MSFKRKRCSATSEPKTIEHVSKQRKCSEKSPLPRSCSTMFRLAVSYWNGMFCSRFVIGHCRTLFSAYYPVWQSTWCFDNSSMPRYCSGLLPKLKSLIWLDDTELAANYVGRLDSQSSMRYIVFILMLPMSPCIFMFFVLICSRAVHDWRSSSPSFF